MLDITKFEDWMKRYCVEEETIQRFWKWFSLQRIEDLRGLSSEFEGDFDKNRLKVTPHKISLRTPSWPDRQGQFVITSLLIEYVRDYYIRKGEKIYYPKGKTVEALVGSFWVRFTLEGEIDATGFE